MITTILKKKRNGLRLTIVRLFVYIYLIIMENKNSTIETQPSLVFLGSYVTPAQMPRAEKGEVCVMGRSNSGKSSLIAALSKNPSLVKTSSKPGSTRTLNLYVWENLYITDLPGYGYATASYGLRRQLSSQISTYLQERENLRGGFLLLDCKREPKEEEFYLARLFQEKRLPLLLLLTKSDRLNQAQASALQKRKKKWEDFFHLTIEVSARNRKNLMLLHRFLNSLGG